MTAKKLKKEIVMAFSALSCALLQVDASELTPGDFAAYIHEDEAEAVIYFLQQIHR
jgi:hypothetical protein